MYPTPESPDLVRPPVGAAIPALTFLGVNVVALNILTLIGLWAMFQVEENGDDAEPVADALALGSILELLLTAAAGVFVIIWLWRARANADVIDDLSSTWSRPWVIFGWVVPVVSLWVPRSIVGSVWRVSAPPRATEWPVNLWWTAYLVYLIGGRVASTNPVDGFRADLYPFVTLAGSLGALLAMLVVWKITRFQEAQAVRLRQALATGA
ncbi:hypothetical protein GCM10022254_38950 [Actinomadura meridiana]|uniref:DUF4328 domain-containing protein n=1 Tax=Actinomadura meridiana TaxID=559626 RepID=A0ABP8C600_9ACTN